MVGIPILTASWYSGLSAPVDPTIATGGLYLVVDHPDIDAQLSVVIQEPEAEHPVVGFRVRLSDPRPRYALVAQGDWAFADYPELNPSVAAASPPRPGAFTSPSEQNFFIHRQEEPSMVASLAD